MPGPWERYAQPQARERAAGGGPWERYAQQAAPLIQARTFERDEDEQLYRQKLSENMTPGRATGIGVSQFGRPNPTPEQVAEYTRLEVEQQRGTEQEQQQFETSRTPLARAAGTAAFAASLPVRFATRGKSGLGELVGTVAPQTGRVLTASEAGFARANEPGFELIGKGGEIALGIPPLSSLGVPARGIAATARAIANKPLPPRAATSAIARAGIRNERLADIAAFRNTGVEPFGPALTETGLAGTVKQLSEAPIVGAPVRNKLLQSVEETRAAGEDIAGQYGAARSYRDVGNVVEQGLERFKDARSADTIESAAAKLPDEALARLARTPARETSIKTKQDVLYERAWRGIPEEMQRGKSMKDVARFWGGMTSTQTILRELTERNQRMFAATRGNVPVEPTLAYPLRGGVAGQIAADIIEGRWRGNLQTMRDVRSEFRRLASGVSDTEKNTLKLSDMRRIQSAMTEDMIGLLERNVDYYRGARTPGTAAQVQRAIHDFRRADQFTRASAQRLETIEKLYGAQSAEQLGIGILKDAMGGRKGGNLQRLVSLSHSLRDEEWGDVASGVLRELGRPLGSARGIAEDAGFSVNSFITNWNNLSPEGRNVLFRRAGTRELGKSLDSFVRVADRMANFEALTNTSRSATNALGMTGLISILTAAQQAAVGNWRTAAGAASIGAGMYGFGRFMTSPAYVRWLTRATELSGQPGKLGTLRAHARALAALADRERDLGVQGVMAAIARAIDDQVDGLQRERLQAAQGRSGTALPALPAR